MLPVVSDGCIYVADSALVTEKNLELMGDKIAFISRLPDIFSIGAEIKDRAWEQKDKRATRRIDQSLQRTGKESLLLLN